MVIILTFFFLDFGVHLLSRLWIFHFFRRIIETIRVIYLLLQAFPILAISSSGEVICNFAVVVYLNNFSNIETFTSMMKPHYIWDSRECSLINSANCCAIKFCYYFQGPFSIFYYNGTYLFTCFGRTFPKVFERLTSTFFSFPCIIISNA